MFRKQQATVDYEMWKGVRIPKTLSRHGNGWKDTFVQMVMHVLGYRAISELDQNNEAVSDIAIRHVHRFSYMGGVYQTAIAYMKSKFEEDVMSRAIEEADRLELEWGNDFKNQ